MTIEEKINKLLDLVPEVSKDLVPDKHSLPKRNQLNDEEYNKALNEFAIKRNLWKIHTDLILNIRDLVNKEIIQTIKTDSGFYKHVPEDKQLSVWNLALSRSYNWLEVYGELLELVSIFVNTKSEESITI